jgi:pyruvate/2-oxoglutarate dehydrogenase complex dihydrolipoamide acyltransferase (E2) component
MYEATDKAEERAAELGVDLNTITGTGENGRITVEDVEKAAPSSSSSSSSSDGVDPTDVEYADGEYPEPGQEVDRAAIDRNDAGVDMLTGSQDEPQGPEDALGEGLKRGDYRDRVIDAIHQEAKPIPGGGGVVENEHGGFDTAPVSELVTQNPRTEEIGDDPGKKGGVDSVPADEAA